MQMLPQRYFQLTVVHSALIVHQENTESFLTDLSGDAHLENVLLYR